MSSEKNREHFRVALSCIQKGVMTPDEAYEKLLAPFISPSQKSIKGAGKTPARNTVLKYHPLKHTEDLLIRGVVEARGVEESDWVEVEAPPLVNEPAVEPAVEPEDENEAENKAFCRKQFVEKLLAGEIKDIEEELPFEEFQSWAAGDWDYEGKELRGHIPREITKHFRERPQPTRAMSPSHIAAILPEPSTRPQKTTTLNGRGGLFKDRDKNALETPAFAVPPRFGAEPIAPYVQPEGGLKDKTASLLGKPVSLPEGPPSSPSARLDASADAPEALKPYIRVFNMITSDMEAGEATQKDLDSYMGTLSLEQLEGLAKHYNIHP